MATLEFTVPKLIDGSVAVVCAGTTDLPVAKESAETLRVLGISCKRLTDVGVAGLHRLLAQRKLFDRVSLAIVVAGMEGALPGVMGGLVSIPVIAVPTSVGYGADAGRLSWECSAVAPPALPSATLTTDLARQWPRTAF